jgi:hypothetical protein
MCLVDKIAEAVLELIGRFEMPRIALGFTRHHTGRPLRSAIFALSYASLPATEALH